jgi:hypothetical protein
MKTVRGNRTVTVSKAHSPSKPQALTQRSIHTSRLRRSTKRRPRLGAQVFEIRLISFDSVIDVILKPCNKDAPEIAVVCQMASGRGF